MERPIYTEITKREFGTFSDKFWCSTKAELESTLDNYCLRLEKESITHIQLV